MSATTAAEPRRCLPSLWRAPTVGTQRTKNTVTTAAGSETPSRTDHHGSRRRTRPVSKAGRGLQGEVGLRRAAPAAANASALPERNGRFGDHRPGLDLLPPRL